MVMVKNGKKLYPVGSFLKYQHMLYNYYDQCHLNMLENECDENYVKFDEATEILNAFTFAPQDARGIVYVEYRFYTAIKDIIGGYVLTHNGF